MTTQDSKVGEVVLFHAWVATQPDGTEGLVAADVKGVMMPLVYSNIAGDPNIIKAYAENISKGLNVELRLKRFVLDQEIDAIKPQG